MGLSLSKYENQEIGSKCQSLKEIDITKVGDVYLMMYIDKESEYHSTSIEDIEHSNFLNDVHYTILVDVSGETTLESGPCGLEIHIVIEKNSNGTIELCFERKVRKNNFLVEKYIKLGKIENLYHKYYPLEWSFGLTRVISTQWIFEYIESVGGNAIWNLDCNCFTFSKYLINRFKVNNPLTLNWVTTN